jgi:hypothetical protein
MMVKLWEKNSISNVQSKYTLYCAVFPADALTALTNDARSVILELWPPSGYSTTRQSLSSNLSHHRFLGTIVLSSIARKVTFSMTPSSHYRVPQTSSVAPCLPCNYAACYNMKISYRHIEKFGVIVKFCNYELVSASCRTHKCNDIVRCNGFLIGMKFQKLV